MARPWPPQKVPIDELLNVAKKLRILTDKIESSSQAIARTEFNEPWILYWPSVGDAINFLTTYAAGLNEQQTLMEMGDPGAPKMVAPKLLGEKAQEIVKKAKAGPKKKSKKAE